MYITAARNIREILCEFSMVGKVSCLNFKIHLVDISGNITMGEISPIILLQLDNSFTNPKKHYYICIGKCLSLELIAC